VEDILKFEAELLDHLRRNTKILTLCAKTNVLDEKTKAELEKEVDASSSFRGGAEGVMGLQAVKSSPLWKTTTSTRRKSSSASAKTTTRKGTDN
jgi:hypothetical protein